MRMDHITFRSITLAQRGERILQKEGIGCTLQRTPRWMEQRGCGYSLRLRPADTDRGLRLLLKNKINYSKVYAQQPDGSVEELSP